MTNADDALAAAEAAEAEAAEAEAIAAAARARAKAIRLRQEADAKAAEDNAAATAEAAEATEATEAAEAAEAAETVEVPVGDGRAEAADTTAVDVSDSATTEIGSSAVELDEPTVAVTAETPADWPPPPPPKRRRPSLGGAMWKVAAAFLVVVGSLALVAVSVVVYLDHRNADARQQKEAEFAAAARQGVVTLMSLDFNRAQDDVQRIIGITTGDFKKDFENQAEDFVKVAQESKVVTEATVNAVAVQKMTDDTATVLLAAMSRVSNIASDKQEPRAWRLSVDVARDGDQLKLAKVEFVP